MIESIFVMLLVAAIILLILAFVWESLTITAVDLIIWMILSISVYDIEVPYQYESGGIVYEATQSLGNMYPLAWLFMALAIIMFLYMITMVFQMWRNMDKRIM